MNRNTKSSLSSWEKWKAQAIRMEAWYEGRQLPVGPLKINSFSTIMDVDKYVETSLAQLKSNQTKPWQAPFKPAYMRLYELKKFIENAES